MANPSSPYAFRHHTLALALALGKLKNQLIPFIP